MISSAIKGAGGAKAAIVLGILGFSAAAGQTANAHHLEGIACIDQGCWVDIYDFPDFDSEQKHIRLCGPGQLRQIVNIDAVDWSNDIKSFVVGRNARVRLYESEDFEDLIDTYGPRSRIYDLGGYAEDVESIQIECRAPDE